MVVALLLTPIMHAFIQLARAPVFRLLMAGGMLPAGIPSADPFLTRVLLLWQTYLSYPLLVYFGLVALVHAFEYEGALLKKSLHEHELEATLARSQLDALRQQLQPHFLFNTLNIISAVMSSDVVKARELLAKLGELLLETIRDGDGHETTLRHEMQMLAAYTDIQQARFGDALVVSTCVERGLEGAIVPKMLLQPIVENSIQHGMRIGVPLSVLITAVARDGYLEIATRDNGPGISESSTVREGVGLGNSRKRVDRLYGSQSSFSFSGLQPHGFEVCVRLPLRYNAAT
jgi:two-component system, LytTR family, sensor kinase